ncbi:hypothetical protein KU6B_56020 (plasmid) [Mameliella alba]|nr:hypothetical protein KU6B_56020 [Mameliella alba]
MKQVEIRGAGGPEVLHFAEAPRPEAGPGEVLVRVVAASVNRPDVQQRRGLYPPPPDASPIPGLDIAGTVAAVGDGVTRLAVGDPVCALTNGGGYAEYCAVQEGQCMRIPAGLSYIEAASLPEAYFTAWNNVMWRGALAGGKPCSCRAAPAASAWPRSRWHGPCAERGSLPRLGMTKSVRSAATSGPRRPWTTAAPGTTRSAT